MNFHYIKFLDKFHLICTADVYIHVPAPKIETPNRARGVAARRGGGAPKGTPHQPDKTLLKQIVLSLATRGRGPICPWPLRDAAV